MLTLKKIDEFIKDLEGTCEDSESRFMLDPSTNKSIAPLLLRANCQLLLGSLEALRQRFIVDATSHGYQVVRDDSNDNSPGGQWGILRILDDNNIQQKGYSWRLNQPDSDECERLCYAEAIDYCNELSNRVND